MSILLAAVPSGRSPDTNKYIVKRLYFTINNIINSRADRRFYFIVDPLFHKATVGYRSCHGSVDCSNGAMLYHRLRLGDQLCEWGGVYHHRGAEPCLNGGDIKVSPGSDEEVMERVVFFANRDALAVELGKMEGNGRIQFGHRVDSGRGWGPANGRPGHVFK